MIKRYNEGNARMKQGQRLGLPIISVDHESGVIRVNRKCNEMMGLSVGDRVEVFHDEDAGEWYLARGGETGFVLYNASRGATQFNSRILVHEMMEYLPENGSSRTRALGIAKVANTLHGLECHAILGLNRE